MKKILILATLLMAMPMQVNSPCDAQPSNMSKTYQMGYLVDNCLGSLSRTDSKEIRDIMAPEGPGYLKDRGYAKDQQYKHSL